MPENKPIQVMRFVTQGAHIDTIISFDQLADYSLLEAECHVAAFVPFGGQPVLLMFEGKEDKVRIGELDYRKLKNWYGGTNPQVRRLIEDADQYLAKVEAKAREVSDKHIAEIGQKN
ncbi:hypothetical protein HYV80_07555 [Candidatus Woesearchaeota archaeon]|nr:hypothetical protein [Candidatus Woesearchaeota archaeon]